MTAARFPFADRPRLWGVAVSHYQVEGNDLSDWSEWESLSRTRGEACGAAVDSWHQYEHDALLAKKLGVNSFRFSISWSRVEPSRGRWNYEALARYRRFCEFLVANEIEPVVTLFHYTHPIWFHRETPWTDVSAVHAFSAFAAKVIDAIGDLVRCYTILNEPLVFVLAAYLDGQIPPGISSARAAGRALENLLAAHTATAALIRAQRDDAAIGIAHNMMSFVPERATNPLDRLIARVAHDFYNVRFLEAFSTGRWNLYLPPATIIRGRNDTLPGSLDFIGVNFYSRLHMRSPGKQRFVGDFRYLDRSGRGLTDNGWEIAPGELTPLLAEAARFGLPIMITENGLADAGDRHRATFLREHMAAMEASEAAGIPIHGYFHWSLLDNYEWLDGFEPKFGLASVDRKTMKRTPRASASVFRELGGRFLRV